MTLTIREPGSAITHFIACLMAAIAASPLIAKAHGGMTAVSLAIFAASMVLLYGASALYHSVNVTGNVLRIFRKIDHMMIFVLIAGSYTPVCLIVLGGRMGYALLALVWGVAIIGMLVKALWITCHGVGLHRRLRSLMERASPRGIPLAAGRRHHIYHRRRDLCTETPAF